MFFSSRACQIIAELGSGHFVRYCEINPDRDQDHQNTPRTLLQTDVLTGTFTFRKHFVFLVFILEICLKRPNFSEKMPFHNQSPGSEGGCQLYKLVSAGSGYSFEMVIDDLNSFSGVTKINLYHNSSV